MARSTGAEIGLNGVSPAATSEDIPRGRAIWTAAALGLLAFLAYIDRQILGVLLVPIQRDLHVSDAAMGALTGTSFAMAYAVAALPMARLADRVNRRDLLIGALVLWSAMTAFCGVTATYIQLLLARMGVAAGESAQAPASMSLLSDLFPPSRRATAISVLSIGGGMGSTLGALISGALNDRFGWHIALLAVAAPGLVLALAMWLTITEPPRRHLNAIPVDEKLRSVGACLRHLFGTRTFRSLLPAMVFKDVATVAWLNWMPTFLIRVHHLTTSQMGMAFGLATGLGAIVSTTSAGLISDRLARRGARWRMYYCAILAIVGAPFLVGALIAADMRVVTACILLYSLTAGGLTGPTNASMVTVARADMRAFTMAVCALVVTVIAAGATPWIIGAINDQLAHTFGREAVRYSLLIMPSSLVVACLLYMRSSRSIEADEARALGEIGA